MFAKISKSFTGSVLMVTAGLAMFAVQAAASTLYTYDPNGRITSALYDNGTCVVYTYDANGNRLTEIVTSAGPANTPTWGTGKFGCFQWDS